MVSGGGREEKSPWSPASPPNIAPSRRCTETPGWNQVWSLNFADPLAVPPGEILGGGDARLDRLSRQAFGEDGAGEADDGRIDGHLLRSPGFEPGDGQRLGAGQSPREVRPERVPERFVLDGGDAVGKAEFRRAVDCDHVGVPLEDQFGDPGPLIGFGLGIPGARDASDVVAGHRQPLDALLRTAVEEEEHGAAPGREPGVGQHGADDRILVVFPRRDDPQVHAVAPHDLRQHGLEPDLEPAVHERRALPHGKDGGGRLPGRDHRQDEGRQQGGNC